MIDTDHKSEISYSAALEKRKSKDVELRRQKATLYGMFAILGDSSSESIPIELLRAYLGGAQP